MNLSSRKYDYWPRNKIHIPSLRLNNLYLHDPRDNSHNQIISDIDIFTSDHDQHQWLSKTLLISLGEGRNPI